MAQPLSTEERLAALEKEVVELKQQLTERLSFEGLRADVKELQVRYQAHEEYVTDRLNNFEEHVEMRLNLMDMRLDAVATRLDTVEENLTGQLNEQKAQLNEQKAAMEKLQEGQLALQEGQLALQSGQEQILAILTGKAKTND